MGWHAEGSTVSATGYGGGGAGWARGDTRDGRTAKRTFNKRCAEIAPLPRPALFTGEATLWPRSAAVARAIRARVCHVWLRVRARIRAHA